MPSLVPSQPKNRGAGRCASEAAGRRIWMRCQPKLPGGTSRCATGVLRMRVVMLRDFRVSDRLLSYRPSSVPFVISTGLCPFVLTTGLCPLSFRPSGSEWRNLRGAPPNRRTGVPILCAVLMVAVRQGPISACGAPQPSAQRTEWPFPCACLAERPADFSTRYRSVEMTRGSARSISVQDIAQSK